MASETLPAPSTTLTYTYDAVGNTETRILPATKQSLTWTSENKLDTITDAGKKTTYVYDAAGNRILENSPSGSTLHLGETEVTTNATGAITKASRSYAHPGAPVVTRTTSNGATTGHKLNVLLADHLGTATTSVDVASGQAVTHRAFKPYGEIRGTKPTSWPNKRSYLGVGIDDAATGLTHIGAREYDQNSGRFLSADPLIDIADPLQMNGYAYSNNSPVSKSDPTGLMQDVAHGGSSSCNTKPGGCVRDVPDEERPSADWRDEGTAQYDYNGDGYISVFPTVNVEAKWKNASKYINAFYKTIDELCHYGRESCADLSFPHNSITVNGAKGDACLAVGRKCPAGLRYGMSAAMAAGFMVAAESGIGRGGIGFGRTRTSQRPTDCKCFLAGTDVLLADKTSRDIEDVEVGDEVLATDPETGETGPRKVTRLIVTEDDKYFNELSIATADGIEKLTATYEHPFWSPSERAWIEARDLKPGMTLLTDEGDTVILTGNRSFTKRARTYNLTVDDLHTYYVLAGETPVLVHNSNCPRGKAPRTPDGKFAKRNGEPGTDGSLDERTVMDQLELDGAPIIRGQIYARVPGFPLRKYDGAVQIDGRWLGVETKGGSSPLTPPQRKFDDWLNTPGNSVTTSGGITLEGTFNAWVPR